MLTIELLFSFSCLLVVSSQRYYAFIETLFVIDPVYFSQWSALSYNDYIRVMVDTANMVFQSNNDLDVKIEVIISRIALLHGIIEPRSQQPTAYELTLRNKIPEYDIYDSIVLLGYQPWEGPRGAQGYAMMSGLCKGNLKIMYLLPYQNAAFYLAHELGHQMGLVHQLDSDCPTTSFMSVMTTTHTVSYEQARWSKCENDFINKHICQFTCVFNRPNNYQPIRNKHLTKPGERMTTEQQARTASSNEQAQGELDGYIFKKVETANRCLFLHYTNERTGVSPFEYSPLLPGTDCGNNSVCRLDRCVSRDEFNPSSSSIEYDTNILYLTDHCSSDGDPKQLEVSNTDPHHYQCIDMDEDFLCAPSQPCPSSSDKGFFALYTRHLCCEKCSKRAFLAAFSRLSIHKYSSLFVLGLISICFIV